MKADLMAAPWSSNALTQEGKEAVDIIADNVWAEASLRFYAEYEARIQNGKRAPKGMQHTLNRVLQEKFTAKEWYADSGYFVKDKTWVRITFRHQMSLGSDFLDALKVCKKQGIELAMIFAADYKTLKIISPNDCNALISFEKLQRSIIDLDGAMDIPLIIGKLTPLSHASNPIDNEIRKNRPRDKTIPQ